ncbi:MAG: helix-turn-helix transcriptional regulator [Actinomycetota bacterium]
MVDRPSRRVPPAEEPPTVAEAIGAVLRDERARQERTLADVAESAAVSLPYLSEVERGRKEASSSVLRSIADALDLPLADVLERSADRLRVDATVRSSIVRGLPGPGAPRARLLAA